MDWLDALRTHLLADGPLTALLPDYTPAGLSARKTVFWDERPQGSPIPALLLIGAGGEWSQHLKGFNLQADRVQFDGFGRTPKEARAVTVTAMDAAIGPFTQDGHAFQRADVALAPRHLNERIGNETVFRVSMDLLFHHAPIEEGS